MDDFPTDYDVIVVGTGMTESILAAAFSRIGKQVLHLDVNEYYGEDWGSFNFDGLRTWIDENVDKKVRECNVDVEEFRKEGEQVLMARHCSNVANLEEKWMCDEDNTKDDRSAEENQNNEEEKPGGQKKWTRDDLCKEHRKFNIDLCPKVLFSRGSLVELLISSNTARYAEFKSVSRVLTWLDGHLEPVPCSRADVFATKNVSVVQKRMLVKILTTFAEYPGNADQFSGCEGKTFLEYLKHKKLPDNLIHYIQHAIAMVTDKTPCLEGVASCKAFLQSLGRYGNTPFIFPMYGCGEMPQCFCRLCAVFGGVYHLKRGIDCVLVKDRQCTAVVSGGQRLQAKYVILSSSSAPTEFLAVDNQVSTVKRAVHIADGSLLAAEKEPITLLRFPPIPPSNQSATVIELGPSTCTTPPGCFLVHVTAPSAYPMDHITDALFKQPSSPSLLYTLTWDFRQLGVQTSTLPCNLKVCSGPDLGVDYDFTIQEASKIFKDLCPEEEFLPRAPDPDEIVLEGFEDGDKSEDVVEEQPLEKQEKATEEKQMEEVKEDKSEEQPSEEQEKDEATKGEQTEKVQVGVSVEKH